MFGATVGSATRRPPAARLVRKAMADDNPAKPMLSRFDLDGTLIDPSRLFCEGVPPIVRRHPGREMVVRDEHCVESQHLRTSFFPSHGD